MVLTLKLVRVASGRTLTALEAESRVNATDISRIERGKLTPSASQLDKLSAALNIPAEELMKPVVVQGADDAVTSVKRCGALLHEAAK